MSLFAGLADAPKAKLVMKDAEAVDTKQRLLWEKELLGLYVSGHPLEKFADRLSNAKQTILQIKNDPTASDVVIAGIVEDCKEILTKAKNEKMAFVRIADLTGSLECVVFPKSYEEMKKFCMTDKLVIVKGKISDRNGERSLLIDKMKELL